MTTNTNRKYKKKVSFNPIAGHRITVDRKNRRGPVRSDLYASYNAMGVMAIAPHDQLLITINQKGANNTRSRL